MEWLQKILELDTELFLYLNGFHNDFWDTIMLMITRKETWFPFYAILLYYIIRDYKVKSILVIIFLSLTLLTSDQVSVLVKEAVQRFRPVYQPEIEHLVHNVLRKGGHFGFVSSHAANSFAVYIFTARIFKNRTYAILLFFWAVIISYSRIYSGVHYPLDLLGGATLGWLIAIAFYKALMFVENHFFIARSPKIEKTKLNQSHSGIIYLVFGVLMITVFITSGILHYYGYL